VDGIQCVTELVLGQLALVVGLQPGPKPVGHAEVARQPQPGIGRDPALPACDGADPGLRHTNRLRQKFVADYKAKYPNATLDGGVTTGLGDAKVFTDVLKKACDNKDLTREGINTAFRSLSNVDTGVVVPLDYAKPGIAPSKKVFLFRPDASQVGRLKQVTDGPYEGPSAAAYTPPGQK
jgi:hypothetical protein